MNTATPARQHWPATTPEDIQADLHARLIADDAVLELIENADRVAPWTYDIGALLNPHEQPPEFIDMNKMRVDYALYRGIVTRAPEFGPLALRIVKKRLEA